MKMKKILNKLKLGIVAIVFTIMGCTEKEDSIPNGLFNNVTNGANLRTIKFIETFDFFNPASKWTVEIEEQDSQKGALFQEIRLYVSRGSGVEKFLKTIPASSFSTGPRGLPTGKVTVTLQETLTLLGIAPGSFTSADKFNVRMALILTDGRVFTTTNSGAQVTGGNYYKSPHTYSVQFFCPLVNAADFNGNYKVVLDKWEDYSIGDVIPVTYVPSEGLYKFRISCANNAFISNAATTYLTVTINPLNGSVTGTSNQGYNYGLPSGALTNVFITGSVGTCTGDINLIQEFRGGYNNKDFIFNLEKQ